VRSEGEDNMSGTSGSSQLPVIYCDMIQSAGLHNGNTRVLMARLNVDGQPVPAVELIMPHSEIRALIAALQKVTGGR
jgi:hypothetical protein